MLAVQTGLLRKELLGGMVVDGQVHPVQIGLGLLKKETFRGNIN